MIGMGTGTRTLQCLDSHPHDNTVYFAHALHKGCVLSCPTSAFERQIHGFSIPWLGQISLVPRCLFSLVPLEITPHIQGAAAPCRHKPGLCLALWSPDPATAQTPSSIERGSPQPPPPRTSKAPPSRPNNLDLWPRPFNSRPPWTSTREPTLPHPQWPAWKQPRPSRCDAGGGRCSPCCPLLCFVPRP